MTLRVSAPTDESKHNRYLAIYRLMQERDREIDPIFDYVRRSTAVRELCAFRSRDLVTQEELQAPQSGAAREGRGYRPDLEPCYPLPGRAASGTLAVSSVEHELHPQKTFSPRRPAPCR